MPLVNCKVYLELNWLEDRILSSDGNTAKLSIRDTELYVPIVTLSTKDGTNLAKQLNDGFERSVYWNSYETKPAKVIKQGKNLNELFNASFQGVKRLFALAYVIAAGDQEAGMKDNKKYFLPRGGSKNYNVLIDGRNFYDQLINDLKNSMMESEKYQQGMVMIIHLAVYWIMHILKTITD